jgi:hypothetical protein
MRERALLLGGTLRVDRGVNGIGTSVHAIVPVVAPGGTESGGTASGGALDIAALAVAPADAPVREAEPEPAEAAAHQLQNQLQNQLNDQLRDQLRAAQAPAPLASVGRDAVPLMRATHPSADGHTRF